MRKSLYILGWMVALLVTSCTESSYDVAELPEDDHRNREKFFSDIDKTEILDNLRCNSNEKFYDSAV